MDCVKNHSWKKTKQKYLAFGLAAIALLVPQIAAAQSIIRDSEIEAVVREYSVPLFNAAGLNSKDIEIIIINDKSLNAFVTDGQKLFLHTGLILEAKTPNQLKGVIAHETGHIAGGHLARSSEAMRDAMVPAYITMALGIVALAAGAGDAGVALLASSQQFAILNYLTYSRTQESSADQAAYQFMEKTNQSPQGLIDFFEKFRYMEVMSDARREPYFRSHPLSTDRISALERKTNQKQGNYTPDSTKEIKDLALIQAKIYGFLYPGSQVYVQYPFTNNSIPARYARAIALYRAPDIEMAINAVQKLIKDEPENPYFYELLGQIYFENNKPNDALTPYKKAVELRPNDALLHIGYARALINLGNIENYEKANDELLLALRYEQDNAFAWNQLAIVADRTGKTGLARLATAEEAFALGDFQRANRFAQVAMKNLNKNTPSWRRASDIRATTDPIAAKMTRKGMVKIN